MNDLTGERVKILFSQAHKEQLIITETPGGHDQFLQLRRLLAESGCTIEHVAEPITSARLGDIQVLVIGAPRSDLDMEEIEAIGQFVSCGGGLLLLSNAEIMSNLPPSLNQVAAIAGAQFREYLNYRPTFLQVFYPHYVTANVRRVKIGEIAFLNVDDEHRVVALTKATQQPVVACARVEHGRVVLVGDVGMFTDELLNTEDNSTLVANIIYWLAARNTVDIDEISVPETVKWGETAIVVLQLSNHHATARPQVECILESDADAFILEPAQKNRTVPPGITTRMQWNVHPQILGEQKLRLSMHLDGQPLFFDQLPRMCCLAPGYFTLEIKDAAKDAAGQARTTFQTGEYFTVEGAFHWTGDSQQVEYQLQLQYDAGLIERSHERGSGVGRWHLQAVAPGAQQLALTLSETGQSLPVMVVVSSSNQHRVSEIETAYVYPLEAEIVGRLRQVEESLSCDQIQGEPFKILSPEQFIHTVYDRETASWLQGVLVAARREQWYNPALLDLVLTYIAPTYLPNRGTFIPYDPALVSHLIKLHPDQRKSLEYNLLCSEESEDIAIKQNVAAYLLHEKFGHGFFYNRTLLGRQLAILHRHGLPQHPDQASYTSYKEVSQLIEDSAVIVNEGFAAWIEITFLAKLDREVRQAASARRAVLIEEGSGLYSRRHNSKFFQIFQPSYDSRYRQGFEHLEFIGCKFNLRCAVRVFLLVTNIDFGITEDTHGRLVFRLEPTEIERLLLDPAQTDRRSQVRLQRVVELLYEHSDVAEALLRNHYCPVDCQQSGCPLEAFVAQEFEWRNL